MQHEPLLKAAPFSGSRVQPFDGTRRYLSTGDLQEATTSFVEVTYADKPSRADISIRPGDVLFARMKGTKKVLEIDHSLADIIVSTGFAVIRPTEHCSGKYLSIFLKSDDFERQKEKYCSGAIQPAITNAGIKNLAIPFPTLDDQKRIAHLLGKVEGLIARRKHHLQQLDDLLKSVFLEMFGDPVRNEKGWDIEPLARLIAHQPNNGLYKPQSSYGSGTKIIRIDSFYDGYVQSLDNLKRVEITNSEYEKYRIETDDILINRVNSIEYLGKLGVVPDIDEHMVYESNMMRFRVDKQAILPIFLMFVWRLPFVKSQITNRAKKAVNQASINQKDVLLFVVPKPPIPLQNQFAAIVEKVEGLKSRYQQSLADLESLYGALSQKAFKGELDLSRVVLPAEDPEIAGEEKVEIEEKQPMEPLFKLPAPEELTVLQTSEGRKSLLGEWLTAWLEHLGGAPFAAQKFMDAARQRLWDLAEDEAPDWGVAEYDELKAWVFEALEQGRLIQAYDDANNRVQITGAKG